MKVKVTHRFRFPVPLWLSAAVPAALLTIFGGCASEPEHVVVQQTGDALVDQKADLAVAAARDKVLWEYRIGGTAIRRENWDVVKSDLDDAIAQSSANYGNVNADAARSRRLFHHESDKPFVGESYERIMANYYRGIGYWHDGEPDNARALFRTGELLDSDSADKTYAGDWVLLDYLDGYASAKLGGDGSDALARARASAKQQHLGHLPDYDPKANVFVFVEWGTGPKKYAGGEYGEQLRFFTEKSAIARAELTVDGKRVKLPPYDDLNYQATTRGGRVMDHILGNKAVFKQGANTVGDLALAGAVGTADFGRSRDSDNVALGLAAVGLISKLTSRATTPDADVRMWDSLPAYLSFGALHLPPGEHPATLAFYAASGELLSSQTQSFTISVPARDNSVASENRDVVVFKSTLPR